MLDVDKLVVAIGKVLVADGTLAGATYLNGSGKISKGPTRPKESSNPQLVLTFDATIAPIVTYVWGVVQLTVYADANANGTANTALMTRILNRGLTLVQAKTTPDWSETGVRIFHSFAQTPPTGPFDNPDREGEFYMSARVRMGAIDVA